MKIKYLSTLTYIVLRQNLKIPRSLDKKYWQINKNLKWGVQLNLTQQNSRELVLLQLSFASSKKMTTSLKETFRPRVTFKQFLLTLIDVKFLRNKNHARWKERSMISLITLWWQPVTKKWVFWLTIMSKDHR